MEKAGLLLFVFVWVLFVLIALRFPRIWFIPFEQYLFGKLTRDGLKKATDEEVERRARGYILTIGLIGFLIWLFIFLRN